MKWLAFVLIIFVSLCYLSKGLCQSLTGSSGLPSVATGSVTGTGSGAGNLIDLQQNRLQTIQPNTGTQVNPIASDLSGTSEAIISVQGWNNIETKTSADAVGSSQRGRRASLVRLGEGQTSELKFVSGVGWVIGDDASRTSMMVSHRLAAGLIPIKALGSRISQESAQLPSAQLSSEPAGIGTDTTAHAITDSVHHLHKSLHNALQDAGSPQAAVLEKVKKGEQITSIPLSDLQRGSSLLSSPLENNPLLSQGLTEAKKKKKSKHGESTGSVSSKKQSCADSRDKSANDNKDQCEK